MRLVTVAFLHAPDGGDQPDHRGAKRARGHASASDPTTDQAQTALVAPVSPGFCGSGLASPHGKSDPGGRRQGRPGEEAVRRVVGQPVLGGDGCGLRGRHRGPSDQVGRRGRRGGRGGARTHRAGWWAAGGPQEADRGGHVEGRQRVPPAGGLSADLHAAALTCAAFAS